ncbi:MAG: metallophosphoesterase, partial [Desulfovibrionaceae bacterium]|nr:metallophosphoesterase [Desulfovibrionaceae bacterium]
MRKALVFYSIFTAAYGLMHLLVFSQAAGALALGGPARAGLALWLAAMTLAPAALGLAGGRFGVLSRLSFTWMGIVFYLSLGSLVLALCRVSPWPGARPALFAAVAAASLAASVYGLVNARRLRVRRVTLETGKLPPGVDALRLAVVSDLHLHAAAEGKRLDTVLALLAGLDFDILASLGDLIESGIHREPWREQAAKLARVRPRLGKYAVGGNHDLYADIMAGEDVSRRFHEAAGFTLLDGQAVDAGGAIWLAGVDYPGHGVQTGGGPQRDAAVLR